MRLPRVAYKSWLCRLSCVSCPVGLSAPLVPVEGGSSSHPERLGSALPLGGRRSPPDPPSFLTRGLWLKLIGGLRLPGPRTRSLRFANPAIRPSRPPTGLRLSELGGRPRGAARCSRCPSQTSRSEPVGECSPPSGRRRRGRGGDDRHPLSDPRSGTRGINSTVRELRVYTS